MPKFLLLFLLTVLVSACGAEESDTSAPETAASDTSTEAAPRKKSKTREPKWEINVDGRPALSGRVITAVTVGAYGNYSMANSDTMINARIVEDGAGSTLDIKYNEDDVRCMSFGDATITAEGDKAVISGEVGCFASGVNPDDHEKAAVSGWFELNK